MTSRKTRDDYMGYTPPEDGNAAEYWAEGYNQALDESEGELIMKAMLAGWKVTHNPPMRGMTDSWNRKNAWMVERSNAFPPPYGAYVMHGKKREFVSMWRAATAREAIEQAEKDMASAINED